MRAVLKHYLYLKTTQKVPFSLDRLVHIDSQGDSLCAWFESSDKQEESVIHVVGTGHYEIKDNWFHLTTVQLNGFVWHFYAEYELDND